MSNVHDDPAALKALQDAIYRDRVQRARRMTLEQRFAEAIELTNSVFIRMHEGAMWQLKTTDADAGWQEVRRRQARLSGVHDAGRFVTKKPARS
ncbi:MAG: hypothetical protein FJ387_04905 [Verrucomicrobia bacterium]|nr:hypothetical protein [Verrucomicrobiota bacterium]